jgi:hypothetical protein
MTQISPLWKGLSIGLIYATKPDGVCYYFNRFSESGEYQCRSALQDPFFDRVDAEHGFRRRYPDQAEKLSTEIDKIASGDFR